MKIYTITTTTKLGEKNEETGFPDFGSSRVVGFYEDKYTAFSRVMENCCDIWETIYDYAIVEEVEEGLYPRTEQYFFKYNMETQLYEPIEKPEAIKHFCNFSIG